MRSSECVICDWRAWSTQHRHTSQSISQNPAAGCLQADCGHWESNHEPFGVGLTPPQGPTPSDQIEIDKIINRYISKQKTDQTEFSRPHHLWCSRLALTIDSPRLSDAECFNVISLKALTHYPNKHRPSPTITNIRPVPIAFGFFRYRDAVLCFQTHGVCVGKVGHSLWSGVSLASSGVRVCRHTEHSVLRCSGFR